jgi:hypothetical protein
MRNRSVTARAGSPAQLRAIALVAPKYRIYLGCGRLQERITLERRKQFAAAYLRPLRVEKSGRKLGSIVTTVTFYATMPLICPRSVQVSEARSR